MTPTRAPDSNSLIAALLGPAEPELTCEACFEQLDRYVDLALAGVDPDRAIPGMRAHLIGCPACADDHDSLLEYVHGADTARPQGRGRRRHRTAAGLRRLPWP